MVRSCPDSKIAYLLKLELPILIKSYKITPKLLLSNYLIGY